MQVGTTKDQGLYNKPSAAVHPGALAAGTLPQYKYPLDVEVEEKHRLAVCYSEVRGLYDHRTLLMICDRLLAFKLLENSFVVWMKT